MQAFAKLHRWLTLEPIEQPLIDWLGSALLLFLRLYVGYMFFASGLVKIHDWDATLALFHSEYMVPILPPTLAAYIGAFGELVFPVLLFVGLFTRAAAFGLFCVNAMAVISYPQLFEFECPAAINDHKYWAILIAVIFVFGAGRLSLDWLLRRSRDR
jgi:putative oxidoreductase